jgi:primosomal protein N'
MDKPIDLEAHRASKKEKCEYCGRTDHKAPFACPNVYSITYYNDGQGEVEAVEVTLREQPNLAG